MLNKSARLRLLIANAITSGHKADIRVAREQTARFDRLRHRVCILCTPIILVIVACTQIFHAQFRNLTPWEGGGFGMFSTVDSMENRLLRCSLVTNRGDFPIEVPPSLYHLLRKSTSMPAPELLSDFARQLAQLDWETSKRSASSEKSNSADAPEPEYKMIATGEYYGHTSHRLQLETGDRATVVGVRVEVMRLAFDSRRKRLSAEEIVAVTEKRED